MFVAAWTGIRFLGKKTIAQMTGYELAGLLLLATVAAEPISYKVPFKATIGVLVISLCTYLVSWMALSKWFYKLDSQPDVIVVQGKIDRKALRKTNINLPFFLSMLRSQGYSSISEVEFALIEPNGSLSVIPKSQERPLKAKDLELPTPKESICLPLVLDGEIQYNNLKYANLTTEWLHDTLRIRGNLRPERIFLMELDAQGGIYIDMMHDHIKKPELY